VLFHYAKTEDDSAIDSQYVSEAQNWFNTVWNSIAKADTP
jgi:hypothetical protein